MLTKGFWIHDEFRDVFIEVMSYAGKHGASGMDVYTIEWWNCGATSPYQFYERDMIGLEPADYPRWKMYDPLTKTRCMPSPNDRMAEANNTQSGVCENHGTTGGTTKQVDK